MPHVTIGSAPPKAVGTTSAGCSVGTWFARSVTHLGRTLSLPLSPAPPRRPACPVPSHPRALVHGDLGGTRGFRGWPVPCRPEGRPSWPRWSGHGARLLPSLRGPRSVLRRPRPRLNARLGQQVDSCRAKLAHRPWTARTWSKLVRWPWTARTSWRCRAFQSRRLFHLRVLVQRFGGVCSRAGPGTTPGKRRNTPGAQALVVGSRPHAPRRSGGSRRLDTCAMGSSSPEVATLSSGPMILGGR